MSSTRGTSAKAGAFTVAAVEEAVAEFVLTKTASSNSSTLSGLDVAVGEPEVVARLQVDEHLALADSLTQPTSTTVTGRALSAKKA